MSQPGLFDLLNDDVATLLFPGEITVDNFAGGGGATEGIEEALGQPVDYAINHDPEAIAMHMANHPHTHHVCGSVWDVKPGKLIGNRRVGLGWFSPDCTYHSKARGGKPFRDRKSRSNWPRRFTAYCAGRPSDIAPRDLMRAPNTRAS
jgi:DNA (cytosine-5)-methyltransferase 1